jgi:hypothetical protein
MKIDPNAQSRLPLPAVEAPGQAGPSRPFADHLAGQDEEGHAATFAELGMFGRQHPIAAEGAQKGRSKVGPAAPDFAPTPAGKCPDIAEGKDARTTAAAHQPPSTVGRPAQARPIPHDASIHSLSAGSPAPSATRIQAREAGEGGEPGASVRPKPRPKAPEPGLSLLLVEEEGEVRVVVGAPHLDPGERRAARRLAEMVLAHSGLSLSLGHFQLNGAPVGPDSTKEEGGSYGTRSD